MTRHTPMVQRQTRRKVCVCAGAVCALMRASKMVLPLTPMRFARHAPFPVDGTAGTARGGGRRGAVCCCGVGFPMVHGVCNNWKWRL